MVLASRVRFSVVQSRAWRPVACSTGRAVGSQTAATLRRKECRWWMELVTQRQGTRAARQAGCWLARRRVGREEVLSSNSGLLDVRRLLKLDRGPVLDALRIGGDDFAVREVYNMSSRRFRYVTCSFVHHARGSAVLVGSSGSRAASNGSVARKLIACKLKASTADVMYYS